MHRTWIYSLLSIVLLAGCKNVGPSDMSTQLGTLTTNQKTYTASPPEASENQPPKVDELKTCTSTEQFFMRRVWAQVAQPICSSCHHTNGFASQSGFVLNRELGFGDQLQHNFAAMKNVAAQRHPEHDNQSHILLKATGTSYHGGQQAVEPNSHEFMILKEFVERIEKPDDCEHNSKPEDIFHDLVPHTPIDLFRKAAIGLAGRLPTQQEVDALIRGGEPALDKLLDQLLTEKLFFERLKNGFNDVLLTDFYLNDTPENLLHKEHYPTAEWWDNLGLSGTDLHKVRTQGRNGLAREPLELIAHIVRNDRPITEILTADYIMVNPYS